MDYADRSFKGKDIEDNRQPCPFDDAILSDLYCFCVMEVWVMICAGCNRIIGHAEMISDKHYCIRCAEEIKAMGWGKDGRRF